MKKFLKCGDDFCIKESIVQKTRSSNDKTKEKKLILMHCENENCHNIYYKGTDGKFCVQCNAELCGECVSDVETSDIFCSKCFIK